MSVEQEPPGTPGAGPAGTAGPGRAGSGPAGSDRAASGPPAPGRAASGPAGSDRPETDGSRPDDGRLVAWVPDLMDRSKLGRLPDLEMAGSLDELVQMSEGAAVALVDLGRPGVLDAIPRLGATRVVGFVGHVEHETAGTAHDLGCEVVTRSKLFGRRSDAVAVLFPPSELLPPSGAPSRGPTRSDGATST